MQGAANEPNVRKVLAEALSEEAGGTVTCRPASDAQNYAGVDAFAEYSSGFAVPVQIVKTPTAKRLRCRGREGTLGEKIVTVDNGRLDQGHD